MNITTVSQKLQTDNILLSNAYKNSTDFSTVLQGAFSYSETMGVNALTANAEYDLSIDPELEKMYMVSSAHKLLQPLVMKSEMSDDEYSAEFHRLGHEEAKIITSGKYMNVAIAEEGLPEFISYLRESLDSGVSLRNALQKQIDRYSRWEGGEWCAPCALDYDMFAIAPETGDVACTMPKGRVQTPYDEQKMLDYMTVFEMADDISTVLRYSYFAHDDDNAVNVERLMKGISERAVKYSTERYEPQYNNRFGSNEWYLANWERLLREDGKKDYKSMIEELARLYAEHLKAEEDREASENGTSSPEAVQEKAAYDPVTAVMAAKITDSKTDELFEIAI